MNRFFIVIFFYLFTCVVHAETAVATFAGGCFWCMEPPFDKVDGVISTTSGYTGGKVKNPTYQQVSGGGTGHYESIQIEYDPAKVSYEDLLAVYWHNVDIFDSGGQFCDRGSQYRAAIFVSNAREEKSALQSKQDLQSRVKSGDEIVTTILPATEFYPAEGYHQDYYKKNPVRYKFYRYSCGRDKRLEEVQSLIRSE